MVNALIKKPLAIAFLFLFMYLIIFAFIFLKNLKKEKTDNTFY